MVVRTRNTEAASLAHHTREWEQRNNIQLGSHHPTQESKESMTPEREKEIRAVHEKFKTLDVYELSWAVLDVKDLLAEIDSLREKYDSLKAAAAPFITHSARLASQSTDGKAYVLIEVPVDDILNLRRELKGP